jgi:hypothetical protein
MNCKSVVALGIVAVFALSTPCYGDETSKAAKVEEFLKLAKMEDLLHQSFDMTLRQMKSGVLQQMMGVNVPPEMETTLAEFQAKIYALMTGALDWEKLKPKYVKVFVDAYSEPEIDDILTFYRSPSGQAMVAKTPQVMSKASEIVQAQMATVFPETQRLIKELMDTAAKAASQPKK